MLWETLLELARQLAAAPPAIAAPVVPETTTAAETKPECVEPHQRTHSGWSLDSEKREFEGQWVVSTKYYSRTVTDSCDGTTTTEYRTEGPTRQWPAVPDQRVADVNRPSGTEHAVTGAPLRTSNPPVGLQGAPAVGPQDHPAANKPSLPDSSKPAAPKGSPFYPGALLLVGVVVAAWQLKRFGGGGGTSGGQGPDPEQELLDWKVKQFQSLARRGRWDARDPQFKDDPEFAANSRPFESLKPETQDTLKAWQKQWDSVSSHWERFFADVDTSVDAPPADPWGLGDIARAQAAEALQGKLSQFRVLVDRLAANPDEFDDLSPELQDLARSIEHFGSVLPSEEAEKLFVDAFAGDEVVVGRLLVEVKRRQYRELAKAGRFDQDHPEFMDDERYRAFALLKPICWSGIEETVKANQSAWKDAAHYWHAVLSGASAGAEPEDVLGVGQFARARLAVTKRQQHWEDPDWPLSLVSPLDEKRIAHWAKVDEGLDSSLPSDFNSDSFWREVGPAPVEESGGELHFIASFQPWVDEFNATVRKRWASKTTDHAGTSKDKLYDTYKLTPIKVKKLWDTAYKNHVDPRLLLAILPQEGTGSFDTNSVNSAYYNGNGPQPDWDADLQAAFNTLCLAKLRLYPAAVKAGFKGDWADYVNWFTPIDRPTKSGKIESGYYAADIFWSAGIRSIYRRLAKMTNPSSTVDPVSAFDAWVMANPDYFTSKYVRGGFVIEQGVLQGVRWPRVAVAPENYDAQKYPGAVQEDDGFYYFEAPAYSVWRLIPGN